MKARDDETYDPTGIRNRDVWHTLTRQQQEDYKFLVSTHGYRPGEALSAIIAPQVRLSCRPDAVKRAINGRKAGCD